LLSSMSNNDIKELIQLVMESGIAELEVERGENRVRIRRLLSGHPEVTVAAPPNMVSVPVPPAVATAPSAHNPTAVPEAASDTFLVKSPIVGTYYDSPSPGSPSFVKVGDNVEPGQVLCIIESMKLMNEIEAEQAGVVVNKLMENGRPVEYGEALFAIRPR
jgi:acetyl-CoA carboxylase biotin carboxyl carrier protein